jgi:hypothetical protein
MPPQHPFRFNAMIDYAHTQKSQNLLYAEDQFSFSSHVPAHQKTWSREGLVAKARRVEELGYTALCVPDHPWLDMAPIPVLALFAEAARLQIGSRVFNVDMKPMLWASNQEVLLLGWIGPGQPMKQHWRGYNGFAKPQANVSSSWKLKLPS